MSACDVGDVNANSVLDPQASEQLGQVDVRAVFDIDKGFPTTSWLNEVKIKYERAVCTAMSPETRSDAHSLWTCHYIHHAQNGKRVLLVLVCSVVAGSGLLDEIKEAGGMEISWHPTTVYDDFVTQSLAFLWDGLLLGVHDDARATPHSHSAGWWTRAKAAYHCDSIRDDCICTLQQYPMEAKDEMKGEDNDAQYESVVSMLEKLEPCADDTHSTPSSVERVFECQDVANLVLRGLCHNKNTLRNIRLSCKLLCHAIDSWTVSTLVLDYRVLYAVRDTLEDEIRRRRGKWEMVRHIIFRAFSEDMFKETVSLALEAWPRLTWIEFDGCDFSRDYLDCTKDGLQHCRKIIMNNCLVRGERLVDIVKLGHPVLAIQLCTWMGEQKPHFPDVRGCSDNSTNGLHTLAFTHNIVRPVDQEIQRPLFEYFSLPFYQERLERLDLSGNKICPDNLRILLHLGEFHKLKKLRLQDCGLHEAHAQMFLDCCAMPQLKHLDLSLNKLGTQVSLYYLSCSHQLTSQLELLDISAQWYFHDDALAGFSFAADPWTSLKKLNLEEIQVNAIGMRGLLQASMPSLECLSLYDSIISADALTVLAGSRLLRNQLRILDLSGTNDGVEVRRLAPCFLAENLEECRLETLLLRHSGLTSARSKSFDRKAFRQLQRCLPKTDIQILPV
ncbi:hypothetical protein PSENEW3_00000546 [Picochlorum sp. SENEW3]|nr:hypothetical protein PSENEW3_00000546 [Picochlorum sp. SENEW3]